MDATSIRELTRHPVVLAALDEAWRDSLPDDPANRHEEGGWIDQCPTVGKIETGRAAPGSSSVIALDHPPTVADAFVIATFDTHPHPSGEGWYTGPSPSDVASARRLGVGCIIRADDGLHTTGPQTRRGGLSGPPGFPH